VGRQAGDLAPVLILKNTYIFVKNGKIYQILKPKLKSLDEKLWKELIA
jgi:hypothetical protein